MQISDEDVLRCDEVAINLVISNAITVNLIREGVSYVEIPVVSKDAGIALMGQLLKYKEGLENGKLD